MGLEGGMDLVLVVIERALAHTQAAIRHEELFRPPIRIGIVEIYLVDLVLDNGTEDMSGRVSPVWNIVGKILVGERICVEIGKDRISDVVDKGLYLLIGIFHPELRVLVKLFLDIWDFQLELVHPAIFIFPSSVLSLEYFQVFHAQVEGVLDLEIGIVKLLDFLDDVLPGVGILLDRKR